MTTVQLTWEQAIAWRLPRQHLLARAPREAMLEVVGDICGLHAQLMSSAELALWARVENLEPDAVPKALWTDRTLVKMWAMRGTLHLLPSAEFGFWQGALSTYRHYLLPVWFRAFGITREELEQLVTAVAKALDNRLLTRDELADEVARLTGSNKDGERLRQNWGVFLKPPSFRGDLCFAPISGQKVRFTHPATWINHSEHADPSTAMRAVTRHYLGSNGPATREDFARWWGMSPAPAGRAIAALGTEVVQVEIEGTKAYALAEHVSDMQRAPEGRSVRLLPAFDQYVVGAWRGCEQQLPGPYRDRIYRPAAWISPVLLINGRMDGVWRHERKGRRLLVSIEPFVQIPKWAKEAAEREAERLASFTGGALELAWSF